MEVSIITFRLCCSRLVPSRNRLNSVTAVACTLDGRLNAAHTFRIFAS